MSYQQYQSYGGNPYSQTSDEAGYGASDSYATQQPPAPSDLRPPPPSTQEPSNYSQSQASAYSAPPLTVLTQSDFLASIDIIRDNIKTLSSNVGNISSLHQHALSDSSPNSSSSLEHLVSQTQILNTKIKDGIKSLEADAKRTPQGQGSSSGLRKLKWDQAATLQRSFRKELQSYEDEERAYQKRYREQIARQYRIVNPEATEAEVEEASNADWGNEGIFQTALKTNRTGAARTTLDAVRARHSDIRRIEITLNDLAVMFDQLAEEVVVQEPAVEEAEANAEGTVINVDHGNQDLEKGVKSARHRRKLQWWTLGIIVLIIVVLAAVLGGYFGTRANNNNNNNNNA
ncbi:MAG: hypothetical protein M1837_005059 [Sclerophora amabilis]|nr:MAG: hypothetical protein M1837_005059 [Sclerophora amabilis]